MSHPTAVASPIVTKVMPTASQDRQDARLAAIEGVIDRGVRFKHTPRVMALGIMAVLERLDD
jgi:hypothetical protein